MPEGDTIHKLAFAVRRDLLGERIVDARLGRQRIESFVGNRVDEVFAHGKHLFVVVGDRALRTHLGMHGSWQRRVSGGARKSAWDQCALLVTERLELSCLRAKEYEVLDVRGQRYRMWKRRLGPDLLAETVDFAAVVSRARQLVLGDTPIADVLLDQRIAAGIGNVFKCEVLFLERCAPTTRLADVEDTRLRAMFERASDLLRANLRPGPRRTRAPRPAPTAQRAPDDAAGWVYGRTGEPCSVCGTAIRHVREGRNRRATWWCPTCQAD